MLKKSILLLFSMLFCLVCASCSFNIASTKNNDAERLQGKKIAAFEYSDDIGIENSW